jgi:hypothetical protein
MVKGPTLLIPLGTVGRVERNINHVCVQISVAWATEI